MAIKVSGTTVIDDSRNLTNLGSAITVAQGGTGVTTSTGSGSVVLSTAPTLEGIVTLNQTNVNTNTSLSIVNTNDDKGTFLNFIQHRSGGKSDANFLFGHAGDDSGDVVLKNTSSSHIKFYVADTERVRLWAGGALICSSGVTLGTAVSTYNAANTLDDYEEGIWTPLLVPQFGAFTSQTIINYITDKPRYTKIGNLVMVSVLFTTYELTKGTGSGNVYLGGLPFECYTSSAATIGETSTFLGDYPSSGSVYYQSDKILLQYRTSPNGTDLNLQVSDLGTTDGSNTFQLTLVYRTQE